MSTFSTIKASDLTANDIGHRVNVITLTGVIIEDVLAEVRYFEPIPDGRAVTAETQAAPQVWVRFKHAAAVAMPDQFGSESDRGFFLSSKSDASVERVALIDDSNFDEPHRVSPRD